MLYIDISFQIAMMPLSIPNVRLTKSTFEKCSLYFLIHSLDNKVILMYELLRFAHTIIGRLESLSLQNVQRFRSLREQSTQLFSFPFFTNITRTSIVNYAAINCIAIFSTFPQQFLNIFHGQ